MLCVGLYWLEWIFRFVGSTLDRVGVHFVNVLSREEGTCGRKERGEFGWLKIYLPYFPRYVCSVVGRVLS